jgi:hypothetical protein
MLGACRRRNGSARSRNMADDTRRFARNYRRRWLHSLSINERPTPPLSCDRPQLGEVTGELVLARSRCQGLMGWSCYRLLRMPQSIVVKLSVPDEVDRLRLPEAVDQRLQQLLDRQDRGEALTDLERTEAEGLVDLAEFLSLLRLRAKASAV